MPRSKKIKHYNEAGKRICGAKVKSRGRKGSGKLCQHSPMANGKCRLHGGKSTGPKDSIAYYKKTVLEAPGGTRLEDALGLINPLDLTGEIGLVRTLLTQMMENPLKVYCHGCKQWVTAEVKCPNEEAANARRVADGKQPHDHHVSVRDNDFSKMILATKQLSEIAKNHKEIQKGKEITIRIEILNLLVAKVVQAYESADKLTDPEERRLAFVNGIEGLLFEGSDEGIVKERYQSATN